MDDVSFVMTLEWELDDETRAAASMLGLKDVGAAWLAFRAHQLDKPPRTRRAWLALFRDVWAPRARNFASTDAARAGGGKRGRSVQQANPAGAAWLREPEVDPLAEPGAPPSPAKVAGAR